MSTCDNVLQFFEKAAEDGEHLRPKLKKEYLKMCTLIEDLILHRVHEYAVDKYSKSKDVTIPDKTTWSSNRSKLISTGPVERKSTIATTKLPPGDHHGTSTVGQALQKKRVTVVVKNEDMDSGSDADGVDHCDNDDINDEKDKADHVLKPSAIVTLASGDSPQTNTVTPVASLSKVIINPSAPVLSPPIETPTAAAIPAANVYEIVRAEVERVMTNSMSSVNQTLVDILSITQTFIPIYTHNIIHT